MTQKILVVDDSRPFRHVLMRFLQMEGYEVVLAEGGRDGLTKYSACQPDLVLMDAHMPQMDGFATVRELRQFSSVPVLMRTLIQKSAREAKWGGSGMMASPAAGVPYANVSM